MGTKLTPQPGDKLRDRQSGFTATVTDVFSSCDGHGMILEWIGMPRPGGKITRCQTFSTQNWHKFWAIIS